MEEKVIYTDGRDVTVTESTLKVRNNAYRIKGITKFSLWTIRPERWPGIFVILLGLAALLFGWLGRTPEDVSLTTSNGTINGNILALWVGIGLFAIGVIVLALGHERYAVRISTAEGDKNALVSRKREYVAQIVEALNKAFHFPGQPGYAGTPGVGSNPLSGRPDNYVSIK